MSDSDDSDIQADIQALTKALSLPATSDFKKQFARDDISPSNSTPSIDLRNDDEQLNYIDMNQDFESLNAYEMNAQLISGLLIVKTKLLYLLQECEKKIRELDEKMSSGEGSSSRTIKHPISNAGMPYFKDKNHFRAPKNYDTRLKESRGELFLPSLKKPSRWSGEDREKLLRAIHNEAIESVLSEEFDDIEKQLAEEEKTANKQAKRITLPRNFREMVGAVGEKEFDWHKISRMDFDAKHSPGDCQAMWNIYLHPDINKNEWTVAEDDRLLKCAQKCKYQDWDSIARLLATSRSAYQCFIRYNTIKKMPSSGSPWTKVEDRRLTHIIDQLRIGDYIPWTDIANHLRYRTKQQIYTRWIYRKAPHLRKGRFTYIETRTLLNAVEKYGTDFAKISNTVMSNRSSVQLSERYHTIMTARNCDRAWTFEDDLKLLKLHNKYSNEWSKIARYFDNKSRTQTRHRFKAIERQLKKNVSLEDIPRPSICKNSSVKNPTIVDRNAVKPVEERRVVQIYDIQLRLYETLTLPPSNIINCQNSYDSKQLVYDTKKLYDTLNLLNANLELSKSSLSHTHLNKREKRLLVSLKEYINMRNNARYNYERVENVRMQMFDCTSESDDEDPFVPPLPFDGHMKTKKKNTRTKSGSNDRSTSDQLINTGEKFLLDVPVDFTYNPDTESFVSVDEEIQFHKLGELLTREYWECDRQMRAYLYKSLKCKLSFDKLDISEYHGDVEVQTRKYRKRVNRSQLMSRSEYTSEEERVFGDVITPNQATLLGLKNLLLWKLLYDYERESESRDFESKPEIEEVDDEDNETMSDCSTKRMESAEYRLLQARLLQLFKLPIGLSNTILEVCGPEPIFLKSEKQNQTSVSKKRKFRNSDSDIETEDVAHNSKVICKRYKIVAK